MADFTQIIQEINDDINTNGVGAITGAKLNEVLRDMIAAVNAAKTDILPDGALYGGFVRPDEPPTYGDDYRYYYLAEENGEYIYFNRWYVDRNVSMFYYDTESEVWRQKVLWIKNVVLDGMLQYKAGKPVSSTQGHIPNLDRYGDLEDSGIAASDVAMDSDVVHNTGAEMVAGRKTFSDGIIVALDNNIRFNTDSQGHGVDVFASEDLDTVKRLSLADMEHEEDCRLGGIATPDVSNDAANKGYVDDQVSAKYSKPSGGIPKTDLASGVQTSLGKADTAFQKPSDGIPASDLATAVQNSLGKADTALQSYTETDPVFSASTAAGITSGNIADWDAKADPIPVVDASTIPASMLPNTIYKYGTLSGNTTFPALATPTEPDIANVYCWTFTTPATAPTITWPSAITSWAGGSAPTINASKSYEVSVMDGFATIIEN